MAWRRGRISWLSWILDWLTRILWLPRILGLGRLTRILWLTRILGYRLTRILWLTGILWLARILWLSGRVGLTRERLELRRVLWLLPGELLPRERRILGLTWLTGILWLPWILWLTGILGRLARQLSWILKLAGVLGLRHARRLHPRKIHLLGLRGILWLSRLNDLPRKLRLARLTRILWLPQKLWLPRLTGILWLPRKLRLDRLTGILWLTGILGLRILRLRIGVALGRLFRPGARNTVARSPQGHVQPRINKLAILVGGGSARLCAG